MRFEDFLSKQEEQISELLLQLDEIILSYPNVQRKIRFKVPFYDYKTWFCYMNPLKKQGGIELCFLRGKELKQIFPYLNSKERKMVTGIDIVEMDDHTISQILPVIEEAMLLEKRR